MATRRAAAGWLLATWLPVASAHSWRWPSMIPPQADQRITPVIDTDVDVPASFDCKMRRLAYEYGRRLMPRQGSFELLYDALGLDSAEGCETRLAPSTAAARKCIDPSAGATWVDPVFGNDGSSGNMTSPLRSIRAALERVPTNGTFKTIVLRGGTHYLTEALRIEPRHSGLLITSAPGEKPVVSGGKRLNVTWVPNPGPPHLRGSGNIYVANISGQVKDIPGLHIGGERATRARYPNLYGGVEVSPGYGSVVGQFQASWAPPKLDQLGTPQYFVDVNHARDFGNGWYTHYMVGIGGPCNVYDPPVSFWCSENPPGGGAKSFRTPSGMTVQPGVLPHAPYVNGKDAVIFVWHPHRWENWIFEVDSYDPASNTFVFGGGGNQGARGANHGGDFFIENVWEELDHPGEFIFDKGGGLLYLYYNGTGAPPPHLEVVTPQLQTLLRVEGTQWDPVRNLTIDGIGFTASSITYFMPHAVPSGGDWALTRSAAVFLQGTENATLTHCTFERLDGHALMLSGYNRYAAIQDSDFAYIGGSAIVAWGITNEMGFKGYDGTDGNHPRYTSVTGNLIREVGLYEKQNSFFAQAKTAQSKIIGNVFFNGPRAGISFNDGFGGGDELAHNLVFSACRESGDCGPFNSWDRQPYLTTVDTGRPSMVMAWREIHHNFFIDNYSPQENVDNDDGSYRYRTYENFLVYGAFGFKSDYGGHTNYHYRNIYAYVSMGEMLAGVKEPDAMADRVTDNHFVFDDASGHARLTTSGQAACVQSDGASVTFAPCIAAKWEYGFDHQPCRDKAQQWVFRRAQGLLRDRNGLCVAALATVEGNFSGQVGMSRCNASDPGQTWAMMKDGVGSIWLRTTSECLTAGAAAGSGPIFLKPCAKNDLGQQFSLQLLARDQISIYEWGSPSNHCRGPGQMVFRNNSYYTAEGFLMECKMPLGEWQAVGQDDLGSTVKPTPSDEEILGWARNLLWKEGPWFEPASGRPPAQLFAQGSRPLAEGSSPSAQGSSRSWIGWSVLAVAAGLAPTTLLLTRRWKTSPGNAEGLHHRILVGEPQCVE